jgi:hypothetical protein
MMGLQPVEQRQRIRITDKLIYLGQFAEKPRQSERVVIQSSPDSAGGL